MYRDFAEERTVDPEVQGQFPKKHSAQIQVYYSRKFLFDGLMLQIILFKSINESYMFIMDYSTIIIITSHIYSHSIPLHLKFTTH